MMRRSCVAERRDPWPGSAHRPRCWSATSDLLDGEGAVSDGIEGPGPYDGMEGSSTRRPTKPLHPASGLPRFEWPIAPTARKHVARYGADTSSGWVAHRQIPYGLTSINRCDASILASTDTKKARSNPSKSTATQAHRFELY